MILPVLLFGETILPSTQATVSPPVSTLRISTTNNNPDSHIIS